MSITPDVLISLAGVVLSLAFGLIPVLGAWYDTLPKEWKPLFMVGVLALVTLGKLLVDCAAVWDCVAANFGSYLMAFFLAVIANQTTYQVAIKQRNLQIYGSDDCIDDDGNGRPTA